MRKLYNPFEKYSDRTLFTAGLAITILGSVLGYFLDAKFDHLLHISFTGATFLEPFIDNTVNLFILFTVLYIVGYFINKKTRVIDILNTVMISRGPFYLSVLVNSNGYFADITERMVTAGGNLSSITTGELAFMLAAALIAISVLVWSIALLYNGFRVATNLKKAIHQVSFALGIIVADILSIYIIYLIN